MNIIVLLFLTALFVKCTTADKHSKYSEAVNEGMEYAVRPFRMAKINAVWEKAQKRLSTYKLRALYRELLVQDKEELALKKFKHDGLDKDGLKEAKVRRSLSGILQQYDLADKFDFPVKKKTDDKLFNYASDEKMAKKLFKDKKVRKLWEKALKAGFTEEELSALKEEFTHHQEKIDQYYQLIESPDPHVSHEFNDLENDVKKFQKMEEYDNQKENAKLKAELMKDKHKEIKHSYDRLEKLASGGSKLDEFTEPKVAELWKSAKEADFSLDELASLKTELAHYEHRLLKLRYMSGDKWQQNIHDDTSKVAPGDKTINTDTIERHKKHTAKLHRDLEAKIMQRHIDL